MLFNAQRSKRLIITALLLPVMLPVVLTACAGAPNGVVYVEAGYQIVGQSSHCGGGPDGGGVAYFAAADTWQQTGMQGLPPRLRNEPWQKGMVRAVIHAPEQSSGGYSLQLVNVLYLPQKPSALLFKASVLPPPKGSINTMMLAQPCMLVDVATNDRPAEISARVEWR